MKVRNFFIPKLSSWLLGAALLVFVYVCGSYLYVLNHLRPVTAVTTPSILSPFTTWRPEAFSYIHQVNERQRMLTKSKRYNGFEIDTYTLPDKREIYVAHDQRQFKNKMTLQAAFAIPKDPQHAYYWIDMKTSLTQEQIDDVKNIARMSGVPLENLIFEPPTKDNAQAKLLSQNGLNVILFVTGFEKKMTPQQTADLVAHTQQCIDEIHPLAISSGMGLYPYLKAYFPNYYKAICYNTTKRPSLKKYFMRRAIQKDPSVIMLLNDEYNWDNLGGPYA